jgi:D-aminopeptidase
MRGWAAGLALLALAETAAAQAPRARDLGVPFEGTPGPLNAITDVAGVAVGHTTLVRGSGRLVPGQGPVRTGVTAILPRGPAPAEPAFAAWFSLNGNGEMTGTAWIDESGLLEGPVLITNTHSVGVVRDATIRWMLRRGASFQWALPVVAETWDGVLNDLNGFHVQPEHVYAALDRAAGGPVEEGAVGGGTGMICNGFKGGIGTSSRRVDRDAGGWTVGVLVQCNYGTRRALRIAGAPVGAELTEPSVCAAGAPPSQTFLRDLPKCGEKDASAGRAGEEYGSIIVVVATDAPLLPHQLARLVKRVTLGLGREGSIASNYSGDLFLAFSTANTGLGGSDSPIAVTMVPNQRLDPLFAATVQATEEAVTNALVAAETLTGADDVRVLRLPHDRLVQVLRRFNRLAPTARH